MSLYLGSEKVENVTAQITLPVEPSDDLPLADGTASAGTSKKFSRADHVHPAQKIPVQSVNNKTGAVSLTASDVGAVPKTGGTMTGDLTVGSASLQTNGYVTGTWLKTTASIASSSAASKIAIINDGWIYSRTAAQIKSDIGLGNVDNVKQYSATNPPPYPVFVCNITQSGSAYTCNKTFAEIKSAYDANKVCIAIANGEVYYLDCIIGGASINFVRTSGPSREDRFIYYINGTISQTISYSDPTARKVTLTTSGWSNNQQSVTCTGVSASATNQEIRVMPADASKTSAYVSCGVSCVAQAANKLTFACDKAPTTAIDVYVVMQSLNFQS